jgi:hypothetical protein
MEAPSDIDRLASLLTGFRDDAIIRLTDEPALPAAIADPLWRAHAEVEKAIQVLAEQYGFSEDFTIFVPQSESPVGDNSGSEDAHHSEPHGIDPVILGSLRKVRDQLEFDLTDQTAPPPPFADPLWQALKLLEQGIAAMTEASGIEEPKGDWTIRGDRS